MAEKCNCSCGCEKEKLTKVYFCPNCKSTDVCYYFSLRNLFGIIPMMQCKKCNFRAPGFPQWVIGDKALKKANAKVNKNKVKK